MIPFIGLMLALALILVVISWAFPPAEKAHSAATFVLIVAVVALAYGGKP
jgi:hypothetical protein